jgi:hypothetical protein
MKRAGLMLTAGLMLVASLPSFAQENKANPKDAYYKTVTIEKIWMHPLGYVVQYWTSKSQVATAYVPFTWFNQGVNSKADIIYGSGPANAPHMVIFWVDGKFDHMRLFVDENTGGLTWGVASESSSLDNKFDVQCPPLDF